MPRLFSFMFFKTSLQPSTLRHLSSCSAATGWFTCWTDWPLKVEFLITKVESQRGTGGFLLVADRVLEEVPTCLCCRLASVSGQITEKTESSSLPLRPPCVCDNHQGRERHLPLEGHTPMGGLVFPDGAHLAHSPLQIYFHLITSLIYYLF